MVAKNIKREHSSNIRVQIESNEYDNEIKNVKKHVNKMSFELHPFGLAMLIIILILFLVAVFQSYQSFNATVDVISNKDMDSVVDADIIFIPIDDSGKTEVRPPAKSNLNTQESSCSKIDYTIVCDSESIKGSCQLVNDGNYDTQWLTSASCLNGRTPCPVANFVIINSSKKFSYMKIFNRIEPDFYINRGYLLYNAVNNHQFGGYKYSTKFELVNLIEPTSNLRINIAEIMGIGKNYQAGLSEIELYSGECPQFN